MGKSVLIQNMWWQDSIIPVAKVLLEPSGVLARDAYSISKGRAIYCSVRNPISLNPMQGNYLPNQICDTIAEAINQLIELTTPNEKLTAKMRAILSEAVKYCLEKNRRTLINVRDYISTLKGNYETRDGIIQRLNFLLEDERLLPIICGNNPVDWQELIENRETLIVDCSEMGTEKMLFLGNLVSQGIKNYFRYAVQSKYQPLALYIDECHNFVNPNFFDILKEGRKYKLGAVLATQDLALFDKKLSQVILNIGNILAFNLGHREADFVAKEFCSTANQLQTLPKYHLAVRTDQGIGVIKASSPPFFRKLEPRVELKSEPEEWFELQSYPPPPTPDSGMVFADARRQGAKSPSIGQLP